MGGLYIVDVVSTSQYIVLRSPVKTGVQPGPETLAASCSLIILRTADPLNSNSVKRKLLFTETKQHSAF